jgi:hypothetical protein
MKHHQRTALLVNLGVTLVILELLALRLQAQSMPYYVCDLRGMPAITAPVEIRGTAQRTPDGLIMFDYTCPSAVRRDRRIPCMALVEVKDFASLDDWTTYQRKTSPYTVARQSFFQILVRGKYECRRPFRAETNEEGEIVLGNGYGSLGLIECRIKEATVRELHALN